MSNFRQKLHQFIASILIVAFIMPDARLCAQVTLPAPGTRLALSPVFAPSLLKGIKVYRNDPFRFDFILDKGDTKVEGDSIRLIKYFLASLTVPEKDLWVNLSPYEKDRIVPEAFGQTEMGRDLLAQDYILKQITASVIYPDDKVGKEFWAKVYVEALKRYGTTDIPVDTFNKVWITPAKATVYEHQDAAYVVESQLKVMLETDYLATSARKDEALPRLNTNATDRPSSDIAKQVLRDVIIPILEKEVNEGQNFATLRQVYNSLILATWYKRKVKASIMGQAYVDQKKVAGIDITDKNEKEKIWSQYVAAFKKGAFDLIKEEPDAITHEMIPRKYFSGGANMDMAEAFKIDNATVPKVDLKKQAVVSVRADMSMKAMLDKIISRFKVPWKAVINVPQGVSLKPQQDIVTQRRNMDSVLLRDIGTVFEKIAMLKSMEPGKSYVGFSSGEIISGLKEDFLRKRSAEEILYNELASGCGDYGIVFYETMLAKGYKVNFLDAVEVSVQGYSSGFSGHVVIEVYDSDRGAWVLIDPTNRIVISLNWNINNKFFERIGSNITYWIGFRGELSEYRNKVYDAKTLRQFYVDTLKSVDKEIAGVNMVNVKFVVDEGSADAQLKIDLEKLEGIQNKILGYLDKTYGIKSTKSILLNVVRSRSGSSSISGNTLSLADQFSNGLYFFIQKRLASEEKDSRKNATGGIDLNPSQLNMTTNTHGPAIEFNLDPAMLARLQNASGVSPVIIGVKPLESLSDFLGVVKP